MTPRTRTHTNLEAGLLDELEPHAELGGTGVVVLISVQPVGNGALRGWGDQGKGGGGGSREEGDRAGRAGVCGDGGVCVCVRVRVCVCVCVCVCYARLSSSFLSFLRFLRDSSSPELLSLCGTDVQTHTKPRDHDWWMKHRCLQRDLQSVTHKETST
jgi:hypothetical protein